MFNVPQDKIDRGIYWSHGCTVIEGCTPVSEGCEHCWAKSMAVNFKRDFSKISFHPHRLQEKAKSKNPKVISLWNDVFYSGMGYSELLDIFTIIQESPQHQFLVLTKRAERMARYMNDEGAVYRDMPNLWLGTSAENQEWADIRIPELLDCKSPNLFVSLEPLLGPVEGIPVSFLRWIIVGCETGRKYRPCDPEWIRLIVRECKAMGVPCFVKAINIDGKVLKDWNDPDFPDDLKVREFPAFEVDEDAK